jgi:PAS domain S-box-containing protein
LLKQHPNITNIALKLISQGPAVLYIGQAHGDYATTFITPNIERQLGYTEKEFLAYPEFWISHIHPDDRGRVINGLAGLFDTGHHVHEYRFQHKDGSYRWMRDESTLMKDDTGNPSNIVGYWVDISDRKEAEEALLESAALLKEAIHLGNLGYWVWDELENKLIHASEEYARILGVTVDQVLTKYNTTDQDIELVHPEDRESYLAILLEATSHGEAYEWEYRIIRPSGEVRHVHEIGALVTDSTNPVTQSYGILQDITEHKRALASVEESEARFRDLYENAPDAYLSVRYRDNAIIRHNRMSLELFGYSAEEIEALSVLDLYADTPDGLPKAQEILKTYRGGSSKSVNTILQVKRKDGRLVWVDLRVTPILDNAGKPVESRSVFRDITERRQAEEALQKSEQALRESEDRMRLLLDATNDGI